MRLIRRFVTDVTSPARSFTGRVRSLSSDGMAGAERADDKFSALLKMGKTVLYKSFIVEAARVGLASNYKMKPELHNLHLYRPNPFNSNICSDENDSILLGEIESKSLEHERAVTDFPLEIFDVKTSELIEKENKIVQDFPLPRSIYRHVVRPSELYYRLKPEPILKAIEVRIAGRGNSRRSKVAFFTRGKFERNNPMSKLDFARSVKILRGGSTGVKVTLGFAD